jgi:type IV pilus assembly protein PilX
VTSLEEKMAGNMRDRNLAFQAAEAALNAGETYLSSTSPLPAFNCTNGLYPAQGAGCNKPNVESTTAPMPPVWENIDWAAKSVAYVGNLGLTTNPRYIIEDMAVADCPGSASGAKDCHKYRITSYATGGTQAAVVMLQSVYDKKV